jgi:heavy-metal resistance protein
VRVALALIGLAMWAGTVHAAPPEPAQDRARTYLMMRLVDGLNLPDDKALALRAIFRKADERRVELTARRQALDKKLRAVLVPPDKDSTELAHLVAETNDVDRELASVAEDSFAEAQKSLTVEQQAKLLLLRRELQGQVREAMRRRLGQRGGHGRPQPKTNHR